MNKSHVALMVALSLASLSNAQAAWQRTIPAINGQGYPAPSRKTGKAAERRKAKQRKKAK